MPPAFSLGKIWKYVNYKRFYTIDWDNYPCLNCLQANRVKRGYF